MISRLWKQRIYYYGTVSPIYPPTKYKGFTEAESLVPNPKDRVQVPQIGGCAEACSAGSDLLFGKKQGKPQWAELISARWILLVSGSKFWKDIHQIVNRAGGLG